MKNRNRLNNIGSQEIIVATKNGGKIREIQEILNTLSCHVVPIGEIVEAFEVEEDGVTYAENALKKARAAASCTGKIAIADDSGLEVDALNGVPGIYSARFGGEQLSQPEKNALLLKKLQGKTERSARFHCVIAVVAPDGREETVEGVCEGTIGYEARGEHGFGFDPVFIVAGCQQTMAELPLDVKNRISHRAKALQQLLALLPRFLT
ncbi:nucleoside-triphosphatase [Candidatus Vecturithrix granuli]|uniref:dITP/XTP pyrophosphatase n=1 Tax=Vecturithrix granuli TaxID=1499967 RepID=A0A081C751_VECG1|nr:nucleoside-triphosphatase [Candidatus Vecturithrix granuli]